MPLGPGETTTTAAQIIVATAPADDAGASTADRYDWQAAMAAADGLALYLDAIDPAGELTADHGYRIVCEHHEDWVAVQGDDAELVSAKHREPSRGVFTTINHLVSEGGLLHLFIRWCSMKEKPTCRLVTTAGLAAGHPQDLDRAATDLRVLRLAGQDLPIDGEHAAVILNLAQALLRFPRGLSETWQTSSARSGAIPDKLQLEQCARFLSMLCIQHGRPNRSHVGYAAPSMYAKPVLDRLGCPATPPDAVWEAVVGLFRVRMRGAGPIPRGLLPAVLAYRPGGPPPGVTDIERELAARIVTLIDINIAIRTAIANPGGYLPLKRVGRTSRMAMKMAAGHCVDNSIERAEQLRLDYQKYWRTRINDEPAARADQERLRRALLRMTDNATTTVVGSAGAWGTELWHELQARIDAFPAGHLAEDMDADLLLGGVCELANRCQVWFSDRFDIDAEIARIRAQRGATP